MKKYMKKLFAMMLAFAMVFTSISVDGLFVEAWGADNVLPTEGEEHLSVDQDESYYFNMVKNHESVLTFEDMESDFSFKLYDDGGKDGEYSNSSESRVRLIAPEGYAFMVTGIVTCENNNDFVEFYDVIKTGEDGNGEPIKVNEALGYRYYGKAEGEDIDVILGHSNEMLIRFCTDQSKVYSGIDFKVVMFKVDNNYNITFANKNGGTLSAFVNGYSVNKSQAGNIVTIKADVDSGKSLLGIEVTFSDGQVLKTSGGSWRSDNMAYFTMPASDITITPTYGDYNDIHLLSYNMSVLGYDTIEIAEGINSFAIYDDGGKDSQYSNYANGILVLKAHEGYRFEITGTVTSENNCDHLNIYEGEDANLSLLGKGNYGNTDGEDIGELISEGNVVTLEFVSDHNNEYDGLDLVVKVFKADHKYEIVTDDAEGGMIEVTQGGNTVKSAVATSEVTVKTYPEKGYVLKELKVFRKDIEDYMKTSGGWYSGGVVTFDMPASDIEVFPVFAKVEDSENFEFRIPYQGTEEITLSNEIQKFNVYDHSGPSMSIMYDNYCNGYLKIVAPEGLKFDISGYVKSEENCDYLLIYDGEYEKDGENEDIQVLGGRLSGDEGEYGKKFNNLISSSNVITLYFTTDHSNIYEGVGLEITVFTDLTFNPNGATGEMDDVHLLGALYQLPECEFIAPEGKKFGGWKIGDETYDAGDDVVIGSINEIKALWKTEQEIAFAKDVVEKTEGDADFVLNVTGNKTDVVYSSDNEKVATIDETTGNVKIVGKGECTINAIAVETDDYFEGYAECKIIVKEKPKADGKSDDTKEVTADKVKVGAKVHDRKYTYKVTKQSVNGKGGEVMITGFNKKVLTKVKVAASVKVKGIPFKVTAIGKKAFANKKKIKNVIIGPNVKKIGTKAFLGNKKLKRVTIKSKVLKKVGKKAFFRKSKKKLVIKVLKASKKLKKKYSKLIKKSKSGKVKVK